MSFRVFILGLVISFCVAWLMMIVVPFYQMRGLAPLPFPEAKDTSAGVFFPKRTGRITNGAEIYAENGCSYCHTQVVRPTYVGNDLFRPNWGGMKNDVDRGDTRRETNAYDFLGERFAQIGVMRMGPDLSNFGKRIETEFPAAGEAKAWVYTHLYQPRSNPKLWNSGCPPLPFLFEKRKIKGNPSTDAMNVFVGEGYELLPGEDAKALVSYLLSLKKDHPVPAALDFSAKKNVD